MSPRAAWPLESLGFPEVYEYSAEKADWAAYGLPLEGTAAKTVRLTDIAQRDVQTCGRDDTVGTARQRAEDWGTCIVVNEHRIVFGRLFKTELEGDPSARVGDGCGRANIVRGDQRATCEGVCVPPAASPR